MDLLDTTLLTDCPPTVRHQVSLVLDLARYLLLPDAYLEALLPTYLDTDPLGAVSDPHLLCAIRDLNYAAGYCAVAKHLYILWVCRSPHTVVQALDIFSDLFKDTDFFWD